MAQSSTPLTDFLMKLETVLSEVFFIPESKISPELQLRDIPSWDSMSHMVFIAKTEEAFMIEFTGDEIADFRSVGDVQTALSSRGIS